MGEQLITVYRGCPIYYITPPDAPKAVFRSECITGSFYTIPAIKKRICEATGGDWIDGKCTALPDEPDEPVDEDYLAERYNDVDIWWIVAINMYKAYVPGGDIVTGTTLPAIRIKIDEALDFADPDEDPPDGLFAQIVAALKTWIQQYMPGWVAQWGQIINNTINNITENITNIYNNIIEYVTNVYNNTYEYITRVYKTFNDYITNVYTTIRNYVTEVYNNTYNYITNVIGVTSAWVDARLVDMRNYVDSRIALLDPTNFLTDPPTYISGIFSILGLAKETKMIESFLAGLEEGLVEETEE